VELVGLLQSVVTRGRKTTPGVFFLGILGIGKRLPVSFSKRRCFTTDC